MEVCPELHLERHLEDHESVVEVYNAWPPTCQYRLELRNDPEKYALFVKPDVSLRSHFSGDIKCLALGAKSIIPHLMSAAGYCAR